VLPREPVSVPVMRRVIGGTLLGFGADAESVADLLLAATEACTNVLRHGERAQEYQVCVSVGQDACLLEIANGLTVAGGRPEHPANGLAGQRPNGQPDGHESKQPDRREDEQPNGRAGQTSARPAAPSAGDMLAGDRDAWRIPESGRGLTIMRTCVDDLTLRGSAERGTVVSMRKRITWAGTAPGYGVPMANGHDATGPGRQDPAALREAS
jgi:serine/threonine-protein kinase RsbW